MKITFEELRRIKHALPTGSIRRIAEELNLDEQTIRSYFGAHNYASSPVPGWHLEPGPSGGIVHLEDTVILERALQILKEHKISTGQLDTQFQSEQAAHLEEPVVSYSTLDEKETELSKKSYSTKRTTAQLHIFEQMEVLRMKLRSISIPPNVDLSQLANEVNNL